MWSCWASSQSIAAYTWSRDAPVMSRSVPSVTSSHHALVASFVFGRTTRDRISAKARSRSRHGGPSSAGSPNALAWEWTRATCPCGRARTNSNAASASTRVLPARTASIASTAATGSTERFASVSLPTRPSGLRNERRSRCDTYSRVSPDFVVCRLRTLSTCIPPEAVRPIQGTYHNNH